MWTDLMNMKLIERTFSRYTVVVYLASSLFYLALGLPVLVASNTDCFDCHSDDEMTMDRNGKTISIYVDETGFTQSVHGDMECTDCHPDAAVEEFPHPDHLSRVNCSDCHEVSDAVFGSSIHGVKKTQGDPYAPSCADCHGKHDILPSDHSDSKTYKMNIPFVCGVCHREGAPVARLYDLSQHNIMANYSQSIHGEGLFKRGLIVTATCTDCHGYHDILPRNDLNSSVSQKNITGTCMVCHARIEEVHVKVIRGELWEKTGGVIPSCTDCHQPHRVRAENMVLRTSDKECMVCHGDTGIHKTVDDELVSMFVDTDVLAKSMHKNMPCIKCHSDIDPLRHRPCETAGKVDCSSCHAQISNEYFQSDHGEAYLNKKPGVPYCTDCHGRHQVSSHRNDLSQTYRTRIPALCGDCHKNDRREGMDSGEGKPDSFFDYSASVHGQGLIKKGLLPSAICTDCHGIHQIQEADNEESTINPDRVPATCGTCHEGIYKAFSGSIHQTHEIKEGETLPSCARCHSSHEITEVKQDSFMSQVTEQCGSCHRDEADNYFDTMHGKAYLLGYMKAAKCSDCHGAHDTLQVDDPHSHVGFHNVVETCQRCHPDANRRFTGYLSHATHHDRKKYPFLFFTFVTMTTLLVGTFGFFTLHTLLWLPRSFKQMREKKRHKGAHERYYIVRFTLAQRLTHLFVILSFMGLALTGMMLKFANMKWASTLSDLLGGVAVAGAIHRIGAVITFGYFAYHIISLVKLKINQKISLKNLVFGPDSMMFNFQDLKDFMATIKWFVGRGPRPQYGRWTYWEKFDYFAVFWGVFVIGFSGLMLWFPEFFTRFFPGWFINVATIIHSDEALLAVGFIFTIHFFNTHLRPEAFPMDPVIFTGSIPLDEYKLDRPREYAALKASGKLKKRVILQRESPAWHRFIRLFGFAFLFMGLILIGLIIYSMLFGYK
jgi:predicted CXXCH cytochrome family protein